MGWIGAIICMAGVIACDSQKGKKTYNNSHKQYELKATNKQEKCRGFITCLKYMENTQKH